MKITLKIQGKEKTFITDFISARMLRKTIEISNGTNFDDLSPDELDELVNYIVELFGKQFSIDDLYDGLPSNQFFSTFTECSNEVTGNLTAATTDEEAEKN